MKTFFLKQRKTQSFRDLGLALQEEHAYDKLVRKDLAQTDKTIEDFKQFAAMERTLEFVDRNLEQKYSEFIADISLILVNSAYFFHISEQQPSFQALLAILIFFFSALLVCDSLLVVSTGAFISVVVYRVSLITVFIVFMYLVNRHVFSAEHISKIAFCLMAITFATDTMVGCLLSFTESHVPVFTSSLIVYLMLSSTAIRVNRIFAFIVFRLGSFGPQSLIGLPCYSCIVLHGCLMLIYFLIC